MDQVSQAMDSIIRKNAKLAAIREMKLVENLSVEDKKKFDEEYEKQLAKRQTEEKLRDEERAKEQEQRDKENKRRKKETEAILESLKNGMKELENTVYEDEKEYDEMIKKVREIVGTLETLPWNGKDDVPDDALDLLKKFYGCLREGIFDDQDEILFKVILSAIRLKIRMALKANSEMKLSEFHPTLW